MRTEKKVNSAVFIMPRSSKAWSGAEALWITVAGWSSAAERLIGRAWVVTSDTIAKPEEVICYPLVSSKDRSKKKLRLPIPEVIKTAVKDFLLWRRTRKYRLIELNGPWENTEVKFVWQQHDLFEGPGHRLSKKLKVPLIVYVHAPVVWEAAKWGVHRPLWGKLIELFSERNALLKANIVACVSQDVAKKVESLGVEKNRIIICPMAVDPNLFIYNDSVTELKARLGLTNKFVIGWTGSFRSFHGLDHLVKAFDKVYREKPESRLLLVGDGFEKRSIEILVKELGLEKVVIFAGKQSFAMIPSYVNAFDIAVVSTRSEKGFHYSPLKLREYLAAGKATIAPSAGEIPVLFEDGKDLLIYKTGDIEDLYAKLITLEKDFELKQKLQRNVADRIAESGTWLHELDKVLKALKSTTG